MVSNFSGFNTAKAQPFTVDVEVPDWLNSPGQNKPPLEAEGWTTIDENSAQYWKPAAAKSRLADVKPVAIKCLIALAVLSGITFAGKLAIAERSGDLDNVRGSQLQQADRSLLVLGGVSAASVLMFLKIKG